MQLIDNVWELLQMEREKERPLVLLLKYASAEAATYTLRSCTGKILYQIKKNRDDIIDEMRNRLDEKYDKTSVLADAITNQIKKF